MHAGQVAEYLAAVRVRVPDDGAQCERCLEFQDELRQLQQRLAASGQYVTYSQGPNPGLDVERELQRWLAVNPRSNAAAGFRAGWARMARLVGPQTARLGSTVVALGARQRQPASTSGLSVKGVSPPPGPGLN